jgi:hypothetical protein
MLSVISIRDCNYYKSIVTAIDTNMLFHQLASCTSTKNQFQYSSLTAYFIIGRCQRLSVQLELSLFQQ